MAENVELAPLRPLADFILESARFQVPDLKDPVRWHNRVLSNLLYYQTNYFLVAVAILMLIGFFHPLEMLLGFMTFAVAFGGFVYITNNQAGMRRIKRNHPALSIAIIVAMGYAVMYLLGSVLVFLFGIAMPLLVILVHASLRLRNIRNKISNKIEFVGLKRTPMGLILEALGQEQEAGS